MVLIPARSRHHNSDKGEFTIQYANLTKDTRYLEVVPLGRRSNFAVALFFMVLIDEVCYTYYRKDYPKFRRITMYPKFIGNCPGGCQSHLHPNGIFRAVNYSREDQNALKRPDIDVHDSFDEAVPVMCEEVFDFFTNHMRTISPHLFWYRCKTEFPFPVKEEQEDRQQ
jgi:hypothetical protein